MSTLSQSMNFEPVSELAFGSISGSFALVGRPVAPAVRIIFVSNFTDAILDFSLNGTEHHFSLGPSQSMTVDLTSNRTTEGRGGFYMGIHKALYVRDRGSAATSGFVSFAKIYGEERSTL